MVQCGPEMQCGAPMEHATLPIPSGTGRARDQQALISQARGALVQSERGKRASIRIAPNSERDGIERVQGSNCKEAGQRHMKGVGRSLDHCEIKVTIIQAAAHSALVAVSLTIRSADARILGLGLYRFSVQRRPKRHGLTYHRYHEDHKHERRQEQSHPR